jgi:DNA-directed RNA polymerase specialized sigma24 family protein
MSGTPTGEEIRRRIAESRDMLESLARREAGVALLRFETPEDLASGALGEALQSTEQLDWRSEEAFRAWLFRVARRHLSGRRDYWFACKRNPGALLRLSMSGSRGSRLERAELADSGAGPSTFAFRREQVVLAVRAMGMLLQRDREIITWTNEGVPIAEQARRLDLSCAAAEKARSRAIERLRRAFSLLARTPTPEG